MAAPAKRKIADPAVVFAALGDETRLALVTALAGGPARSIAELTRGTKLTRQGITKHLRVLEGAGLVKSVSVGRESRYEYEPRPVEELRHYLDRISAQWDQALGRLKTFVES